MERARNAAGVRYVYAKTKVRAELLHGIEHAQEGVMKVWVVPDIQDANFWEVLRVTNGHRWGAVNRLGGWILSACHSDLCAGCGQIRMRMWLHVLKTYNFSTAAVLRAIAPCRAIGGVDRKGRRVCGGCDVNRGHG